MVRKPLKTFQENLQEVKNLLAIHSLTTGKSPGRRSPEIAVLNRSGIVLLVACWEAFVEDLADKTFSALLRGAPSPFYFPKSVQKLVAQSLRADPKELKLLNLAGDGWRSVFEQYKIEKNRGFIGGFNTPSAKNIDDLFAGLIGLPNLSKCWTWRTITPADARKRLTTLIKLRGDIAHRVKSRKTIHKSTVEQHLEFIQRLAEHSNYRVDRHLKDLTRR